jgi:hypothetical protein
MSYRWDTTNDFAWLPPVNLGPGVNTNDPDFGAAYIENEWGTDTLLFGRRVNGGLSDIYMSERQWDGSFGDAEWVWQLVLGVRRPPSDRAPGWARALLPLEPAGLPGARPVGLLASEHLLDLVVPAEPGPHGQHVNR